jgi:hypothetical protein
LVKRKRKNKNIFLFQSDGMKQKLKDERKKNKIKKNSKKEILFEMEIKKK